MAENENKTISGDEVILTKSVAELVSMDTRSLTKRQMCIRLLLLVYAKEHLDSDSIGYGELIEIVFDEICETIGDKAYQKWMKEFDARNE